MRAEINIIFGYNEDIYTLIHKKLLIGLIKEKLIEKRVVRVTKK
jgi:hypothetical protein